MTLTASITKIEPSPRLLSDILQEAADYIKANLTWLPIESCPTNKWVQLLSRGGTTLIGWRQSRYPELAYWISHKEEEIQDLDELFTGAKLEFFTGWAPLLDNQTPTHESLKAIQDLTEGRWPLEERKSTFSATVTNKEEKITMAIAQRKDLRITLSFPKPVTLKTAMTRIKEKLVGEETTIFTFETAESWRDTPDGNS